MPTPEETPAPTPLSKSEAQRVASAALLQISDLPSGYYEQSSDVQAASGGDENVLAIGTKSFASRSSTLESLQGKPITVANAVVVLATEESAKERTKASYIEATTVLTMSSIYGITGPDSQEVSFVQLGDETTAIDLSGHASFSGQSTDLTIRTVAVRKGTIVATITTVGLAAGPISELETMAKRLEARLIDASR